MKLKGITIKRQTEAELDKAIADLEKRGFTCIQRGQSSRTEKQFRYRDDGKFSRKEFSGDTCYTSYWAILRKEEAV